MKGSENNSYLQEDLNRGDIRIRNVFLLDISIRSILVVSGGNTSSLQFLRDHSITIFGVEETYIYISLYKVK